ncbi:hypothetical protein TPA0907_46680 [Micromonospora humidisoli]|nr:hypothetical protein TPA0907_46680 [Micromonospora sp. AKA109]
MLGAGDLVGLGEPEPDDGEPEAEDPPELGDEPELDEPELDDEPEPEESPPDEEPSDFVGFAAPLLPSLPEARESVR